MYCKHCGAPYNASDKFCRNCGAPKRFALGENGKEKAFWRHGWFTILMLFMCFPVGVILVFINHPSIVKTFMMFILGLVVLTIGAFYFGGCSLDIEKPVPRKTEPVKGEYVDNRMEKMYVEYDLAFAHSGRCKYNL